MRKKEKDSKNKRSKKSAVDFPSSNFVSDKGKATSKYAPKFSYTAVASKSIPHENPTKLISKLNLPSKYASLVDNDQQKLMKLQSIKKKKESKMKDFLKAQMMLKEKQIQEANEEEKKIIDSIPINIFQDREGRIRDHHGNIINLKVSRSCNTRMLPQAPSTLISTNSEKPRFVNC